MSPLIEQLMDAYRREERLYADIVELVDSQCRIMEAEPDPPRVLEICRHVEEKMEQIAAIEQELDPLKGRWEEIKQDAPKEFDVCLARIQTMIEEITTKQSAVLESLRTYVQTHQDTTASARASVNARRARSAYQTG